MTSETKVVIGIVLVSVAVLIGLVFWGGGQGGAVQSDLPDKIKTAVAANDPAFPVGDLVNATDYQDGSPQAKVTLVEFSDFMCPYCKVTHPQITALRSQFTVDELRIVFRHLPIVEIHNEAYPAARAAQAATIQGKFPQYAEQIFADSENLSDKLYVEIAQDLGLDVDKFNQDRESDQVAWESYRAINLFNQNSWPIQTPTIYINGQLYSGDRTTTAIADKIRSLLKP